MKWTKVISDFISGYMNAGKKKWPYVKAWAISFLKGSFVKFAIKKVLKSGAATGIKGWIVTTLAGWLYDELGEPTVKYILRKGRFVYYRADGKMKIRRLRESENEGPDDYDNAMDDLFK